MSTIRSRLSGVVARGLPKLFRQRSPPSHHFNQRRMIDLAPAESLQDHSSRTDLIEEIKRVVLGPRTWSPTWSSAPEICREILMPNERASSVRVLPGGRYLALKEQPTAINFLEVATGRCVRTYTYPTRIESWAFDMKVGGEEIVIVFIRMDVNE